MVQPAALRGMAAIGELQIRHIHPVRQRMVERDRDMPASPGDAAPDQGLQNALIGGHPGGYVTDRDAGCARAPPACR